MQESPSKENIESNKKLKFKKEKKIADLGITEQQLKTLNKRFLPVEAYDPWIDTEDPVAILNEYMD